MTNISSHPKPTKSSDNSYALPPKPYTEYTIFFRLERAYILQSSGIIDEETVSSLNPNHHDALEFPRPAKYQCLAMPPYWYSSSHKAAIEKKRKHRKRAGRMDLKTLSKTISASWRNADRAVVEYCRKLSRAELEKYNQVVEGILAKQDADEAAKNQTAAVQQWKSTLQECRPFKTIPDCSLSLRDFVVDPPTQEVSATMPVFTPPMTKSITSNSYNKIGICGQINEGPTDAALLRMLQLQQLKASHEKMKLDIGMSSHSDPLPKVSSPFSNNDCLSSTSSGPLGPLLQKKRKFVRRASAPPEFTDMKPFMGLTSSGMNVCGTTVDNNNFFHGEVSCAEAQAAKQMRRRCSTSAIPSQDMQELKQLRRSSVARPANNLSASFQQELRGSFTCVPEWEKKDADTLLGILNDDPLQVESSCFSLGINQDNAMSVGPRLLEPQINDFAQRFFQH